MSSDTLEQIRQMLQAAKIEFKEVEHAPTHTSEESARARGEPLGVGAKALVLRTNETFRLFVLPADRKLDWAAVKREPRVYASLAMIGDAARTGNWSGTARKQNSRLNLLGL